jgi:hypothetical protein
MHVPIPYREARELLAEAEREMESIPSEQLFNDPSHQKLKERCCAGIFGVGYAKLVGPCQIAVNEDRYREDVDIFLRAAGHDWEFQLAEVQFAGRRRGLEYRLLATHEMVTSPYRPRRGEKEGPSWLSAAVKKKVDKRYASSKDLNLLLYANFDAANLDYPSIVASLSEYAPQFASLWIVTSVQLCSVFSDPRLGSLNGWGQARDIEDYYV